MLFSHSETVLNYPQSSIFYCWNCRRIPTFCLLFISSSDKAVSEDHEACFGIFSSFIVLAENNFEQKKVFFCCFCFWLQIRHILRQHKIMDATFIFFCKEFLIFCLDLIIFCGKKKCFFGLPYGLKCFLPILLLLQKEMHGHISSHHCYILEPSSHDNE